MNFKVYQIYYQEEQRSSLFLDALPYFNQNLDHYFENRIIIDLYKSGRLSGEYAGVLSWKVRIKNKIQSETLKELLDLNHKIFSFTYDRHDVLGYAEMCHPGFYRIFQQLLKYLNIMPVIRPLVGLYQNAIIAEADVYTEFIENILMPAIEFLDNCSDEIKEQLFSDSKYKGNVNNIIQEKLGNAHYTYHTFILERLWSVYYHIHRKKLNRDFFFNKIKRFHSNNVNSKGILHGFNI